MYPQLDLKTDLGALFMASPSPLGTALPSFCDNPLCQMHFPFSEEMMLETLQTPVTVWGSPSTHLLDGKLCVRRQASFALGNPFQGGFTQLSGWLCHACHAASTFDAWTPDPKRFCNNARCRYHVPVMPWLSTLHAGKAVKVPSLKHLVTELQVHRTTFTMADKQMEKTVTYQACPCCKGVVKLFTLDQIYSKDVPF